MTRVPTLASHTLMLSRLMTTQSKIYDLDAQLSTEKKSQDYSGIASDALCLINFENEANRINTYITTNTGANVRLSTMNESVSGALQSLITFRDDLSSFLSKDITTMSGKDITTMSGKEVSLITFRDDLSSFLSKDITTMSGKEVSGFADLQARAFNFMKVIQDYFDIKLNGQYLFGGGKSNTPPVDTGFDSLKDFQAIYDGNTITAPESRLSHMNNTKITSANTGNLTFNAGGTITAATAEAFNLQHYDNGDTDNVAFSAANGTITATTAGAFSNVAAGMMIRVGGTGTDNDRFYTVQSVFTDGRTITVEPDIAVDIAASATAEISVPAIQPGQITIKGSDNNSRTFTVSDISADGTTLTVTPPPTAEVLTTPHDAQISNNIYYHGGETVVEHRVSNTRSIEFGINAKDGAVEKAFRAFGMVLQGMPTDSGTGEVDGNELSRRLNKALSVVNDAIEHKVGNSGESVQDFGRLKNLLASNQVVLNSAISNQKTYFSFLATRVTDMENANQTEVLIRIKNEIYTLQVSYAALNKINNLSLLNYMD